MQNILNALHRVCVCLSFLSSTCGVNGIYPSLTEWWIDSNNCNAFSALSIFRAKLTAKQIYIIYVYIAIMMNCQSFLCYFSLLFFPLNCYFLILLFLFALLCFARLGSSNMILPFRCVTYYLYMLYFTWLQFHLCIKSSTFISVVTVFISIDFDFSRLLSLLLLSLWQFLISALLFDFLIH